MVDSIMDAMRDGMDQIQDVTDAMGDGLPEMDDAEFEAAFAELDSPEIVDPPTDMYLGLDIPTAPSGNLHERADGPVDRRGDLGRPGLRHRGGKALLAR